VFPKALVQVRIGILPNRLPRHLNHLFPERVLLLQELKLGLSVCVSGVDCHEGIFRVEFEDGLGQKAGEPFEERAKVGLGALEDGVWPAAERSPASAAWRFASGLDRGQGFEQRQRVMALFVFFLRSLVGQHQEVELAAKHEQRRVLVFSLVEQLMQLGKKAG